jgi:hypothetical protein
MATLLRELQAARASGDDARKEAAALRQRLAVPPDDETVTLRRELEAARRDAQAAREEARRLAERLAFATASPARRAEPPPRPAPAPRADPAYLELGLSPDLPDELLPVLERAYLRHHHPDRAPPDQREAATVRFQAVTLAFGRIRRLRGMAG